MNERVRKIRKAKSLTMEAFGKRLGVSKTAISNIENGNRNLTDQMTKSICREFNVNEEWLRTGAGEMFLPDASEEMEALARRYGLSYKAQVLVEKFVNLSPEDQDAVLRFIEEIGTALAENTESGPGALPKSIPVEERVQKLSIDERVELYRRELEREEKAAEKSEA